MIVIEGHWWFIGALIIFALHVLHLRSWRLDQLEYKAWRETYNQLEQKRHDEFMHALDRVRDGNRAVDAGWSLYKNDRGQA